ncbi:hypothetical protein CIB84_006857, partial [Bambusicola thoracicus]
LEASVIVRDMCLADNAISARKDSTIYNSQTLMAAVLVTVIPLGQSMEILPVTKIQASASAKQMLLGRRCNECKPGFYFSPSSVTGCLPCLCHTAGSVNQVCDKLTGQCICQDVSVTGRTCERCKEHHFGFDSVTGR